MPTKRNHKTPLRVWIALGAFLSLAALMYVSIMYKIINYGP